jgi:glutamate synthase (ferredoxin)
MLALLCHNGEINATGNNISHACAELMKVMFLAKTSLSQLFEGKSDSASMDMVIELLLMTGRSPSHDDGG